MSQKPILSIGMIVKNEIRCLEKCLKALQPLRDAIPCELVIADTGSTDGTREVAEKYADILFDFEWINDFAAARNAVIRRCSGKWYMSVDADEYLVPEIDELLDFLRSPQADAVDFASYTVRNQYNQEMKGPYHDHLLLRMARIHPELHFEGAIHETFAVRVGNRRKKLNKTVFNHDGYASLTPEHTKKKGERNLALLEPILEREPLNLKVMLQTLESANMVEERCVPHTRSIMKTIMGDSCTGDACYSMYAPAIVKESLVCATDQSLPELEAWYRWGAEKFPESSFIKIDSTLYFLNYLYKNDRYKELFDLGDVYLVAANDYLEHGLPDGEIQVSSITGGHPMRIHAVHFMLAEACYAEEKFEEMFEHLSHTDLQYMDSQTLLPRWFELFEDSADLPMARETIMRKLIPVYEKRESGSDEEKQLWERVFFCVEKTFAIQREDAAKLCQLYADFPGEIGICARLVSAQSMEEGQTLLDQIEDWSMVMPHALQNAMKLGLVFPDAFYHVLPERLHSVENAVSQGDDAAQYALRYTEPEQITDWHRLCFAFDFLCAVCMHKESFSGEYGDALSDRFAQVGALFLSEYYNPNVLANEDAIDRLPALHRFAWRYVRAVELRLADDWVGYVTELRKALSEAEPMKPFVQNLLSDVQERQKRERIAAAPPELIALAEQVKAILTQYPADDPAVVALKQTPVYQQVAFLIEE